MSRGDGVCVSGCFNSEETFVVSSLGPCEGTQGLQVLPPCDFYKGPLPLETDQETWSSSLSPTAGKAPEGRGCGRVSGCPDPEAAADSQEAP